MKSAESGLRSFSLSVFCVDPSVTDSLNQELVERSLKIRTTGEQRLTSDWGYLQPLTESARSPSNTLSLCGEAYQSYAGLAVELTTLPELSGYHLADQSTCPKMRLMPATLRSPAKTWRWCCGYGDGTNSRLLQPYSAVLPTSSSECRLPNLWQ